jgi:hypothetical protein
VPAAGALAAAVAGHLVDSHVDIFNGAVGVGDEHRLLDLIHRHGQTPLPCQGPLLLADITDQHDAILLLRPWSGSGGGDGDVARAPWRSAGGEVDIDHLARSRFKDLPGHGFPQSG